MTPTELKDARILVVGAGLTGVSVMRYLTHWQIPFEVADATPESAAERLSALGFQETRVHAFDAQRFANVDVLILSPGVPRSDPAVASAIAAGVHVIGDIELFASVVTNGIVAITGSNGKSTVASWLAHVLAQADRPVVLCGNIGTPVLDSLLPASGHAEQPAASPIYVLELSSYQLESTTRLCSEAATVLNISDDHMDRYNSIDHYADTKRRIYQGATRCVFNQNDRRTWPADAVVAEAASFVSFSSGSGPVGERQQAPNGPSANDAMFDCSEVSGETVLRRHGQAFLPVADLPLPGEHNVANALAVLALAEPFSLDDDALRVGLTGFRGLPHRLELVRSSAGVRWYNDSKGTNIDACNKAIRAMPGPVVLIAGGLAKEADFSALRDSVSACVKAVVLLGQDRDQLRVALEDLTHIELVESMTDAVSKAAELVDSGDVVLLSPACASFDMFTSFEHRGAVFTEAVEALAA